ncbi:MAG: orotidine-5'-phosphate decarboxylase, partial [bacterium]|nr:orotidine-5'-phosphate decarboxylase [bacterium]
MNFIEKVKNAIEVSNSNVCVGLDTDIAKIPEFLKGSKNPIFDFNKEIIDHTKDDACAYKLNMAFYEAAGKSGMEALQKTVEYIPDHIVKIIDAKRGDIGNTSRLYAKAIFEVIGGDCITVNPYMGYDSIGPFLDFEDKGIFLLCLTSNKGSADFQQLQLENNTPLYMAVANKIAEWSEEHPGKIGMVVGATHPEELKTIRSAAPSLPFLIPGIGAQKGDLTGTVEAGIGAERAPALINSSRGIIYSSSDKDFAEAAGASCGKLK